MQDLETLLAKIDKTLNGRRRSALPDAQNRHALVAHRLQQIHRIGAEPRSLHMFDILDTGVAIAREESFVASVIGCDI